MRKLISMAVVFVMALFAVPALTAQDIFDAIRGGDFEKTKELLKEDPLLVKTRNARQSTPLHVAVDVNNEPIARYLIEKGADL
ncbi:MAG: ankyrin repeat domain-containing protein, partial [Candidatus Aminicenantes bacterium]|nr:ankyrin repeat domain-containing protein [Candidatus Aminicenantes bacterium]